MNPVRRRKKRPNYGIRTVEISRGKNGFGFTISGQQPCILSCIVPGSPAERAGLRAGDYLAAVNGQSVSKIPHDDVVRLIGSSSGVLRLQIAENYYSDSSDEENILLTRTKPKYSQRQRTTNVKSAPSSQQNRVAKVVRDLRSGVMFDKAGNIEEGAIKPLTNNGESWELPAIPPPRPCNIPHVSNRKENYFIVGYLGTIEMPKQILPGSRSQVVRRCIKRLRAEKCSHTWVLMNIHSQGITLFGRSGNILAEYPVHRITFCGPSSDDDKKYIGLVTITAVEDGSMSSSCHVFAIQPNLFDHDKHVAKAMLFKLECTKININEGCNEFPATSGPILNVIKTLYLSKENDNHAQQNDMFMANSPQPSQAGSTGASSNSDSGIGFRDDCGNQSDRIVMVDIENQRLHIQQVINDSKNLVDSLNIQLQSNNSVNVDKPSLNLQQAFACVNALCPFPDTDPCTSSFDPLNNQSSMFSSINEYSSPLDRSRSPHNINSPESNKSFNKIQHRSGPRRKTFGNNLLRRGQRSGYVDLSSPRVHNEQSIFYQLGLSSSQLLYGGNMDQSYRTSSKSSEDVNKNHYDILTNYVESGSCSKSIDNLMVLDNDLHGSLNPQAHPRNIDSINNTLSISYGNTIVLDRHYAKSVEDMALSSDKSSEVLLSYSLSPRLNVTSEKSIDHLSLDNFTHDYNKKFQYKSIDDIIQINKSCSDDLILSYKLSPKVFGLQQPFTTQSLEDLKMVQNGPDRGLHCLGVGNSPRNQQWGSLQDLRSFEPALIDETPFSLALDEKQAVDPDPKHVNDIVGSCWSSSFEKLLEDPVGLQSFAEFLKKEFSEENIKFWVSCEEFRNVQDENERKKMAREIYNTHLCVGAMEPVNVDAHALQVTQENLTQAPCDMFMQAQKQVFNLMKFDSYPRFIKSDIYKECLLQNDFGEQSSDVSSVRGGKLTKSRSDAEDCRRKSLLPWHRKNRSKSKDRGESDYKLSTLSQRRDSEEVRSEITSSRSSLASWDLALRGSFSRQSITSGDTSERDNCCLCRVILSDGATTVVQVRINESIRELIHRLLEKRGLHYTTFEVYFNNSPKSIPLDEESMTLSNKEVRVEQRVVFRLDLPNHKTISVKAKATKTLGQVLRPVLNKYSYSLEAVTICQMGENQVVELTVPITSVEGKRLTVLTRNLEQQTQQTIGECKTFVKPSVVTPTLDEITNKVFEELLQGKSESYDHGSVKSEEWGSEHSSGIFGRFLRRDSSAIIDKNRNKFKKIENNKLKQNESVVCSKPPIISKWRTPSKTRGVSDSDELYEGLKRAQRSRLEDQRGTEINFELPDFLKDKENAPQCSKKHRRLRLDEENADTESVGSQWNEKATSPTSNVIHLEPVKDGRTTPRPLTCKTYETPKTTVIHCDNNDNNSHTEEDTQIVANNNNNLQKRNEPPPLPPKPKHLPSKFTILAGQQFQQQNNNHFNNNIDNKCDCRLGRGGKRSIYLDQPSSSFV